jgi:putative transposase
MPKPKVMSLDQKPSNIAVFQHQVSEFGLTVERLGVSNLQVENDSTTSKMLKPSHRVKEKKEVQLSIQEGIPKQKSKGKSNGVKSTTKTQKKSPTLGQESTLKERDSRNSYLKSKIIKSEELWLPTEAESVRSDLSSLKNSLEPILSNSWFSTTKLRKKNIEEISSTSSNTLLTVTRARFYRLRVSKDLKVHINRTINSTRYIYNQCVELYEKEGLKLLKELRSRLINSKTSTLSNEIKEEFDEVPYDLKDSAIRDFVAALKSSKKTMKKMYFRSRKVDQQSFTLPHKYLKKPKNGEYTCFPTFWKGEVLRGYKEQLPSEIIHDCRVILRKDGKIFLSVPYDADIMEKDGSKTIALDPGVRVFQTCYDNIGNAYLVGEDCEKLRTQTDIAQRMREGILRNGKRGNSKQRKRLLKVANRIEQKVKDRVSDIHRKLSKFLCERYDKVIIPKFDTKSMVEKIGPKKRKIGPKTSKSMICWSHYKFRQLLINKGEVTGSKVVVGTEEYTSKTCGRCGNEKMNLGSDKVYNCDSCGISIHRDVNAARNILILNS